MTHYNKGVFEKSTQSCAQVKKTVTRARYTLGEGGGMVVDKIEQMNQNKEFAILKLVNL